MHDTCNSIYLSNSCPVKSIRRFTFLKLKKSYMICTCMQKYASYGFINLKF